ncbi:MAG: alkaline phosphatase D family protein [Bryobacterales bacterium]|nr:alkaline phosphatase D family protein [Bryobacterales bacterium]
MNPTRRHVLGALAAGALYGKPDPVVHQATGVKIGEVTPQSAVLWTRRTATPHRNDSGTVRKGHGKDAKVLAPGTDIATLEGAAPAGNGLVRVMLETASGREKKRTLGWVELNAANDSTHAFRIEGLTPNTLYKYAVETRGGKSKKEDGALTGFFRTAPVATDTSSFEFSLVSCQIYCRQDREDGYWIYDSLEKRKPAFLLSCGDNVYYDSDDPVANSEAVARYHWQRMYSLPTIASCLRNIPGYWQKDDHDLLSDDCWPGIVPPKQAPLKFEQGQRLFREQVPLPEASKPLYRTFRWGRDVEIWLPDSRDYRSPNDAPDGEQKTIWGPEQKAWLKKTLANSTARWKVLVNPNPIVGPDHARKNDNHANPAFAAESLEIRKWLRDNVGGSVILMNGDRHWQYHSVDPEFGLHEFGCGPASDEHAVSPSRGEDKKYHQFLRIKGGFVNVKAVPGEGLFIEHCDVKGRSVYQKAFRT